MNAEESLARLIKGNRRFYNFRMTHPHQDASRLAATAHSQEPFAAILCCSDSRIPPEIIFDQGLGDLFVVRVAGNVADDVVIGSLEYAVSHLNVPLVVVLGHTDCGAVKTALARPEKPAGYLHRIISSFQPSVRAAGKNCGDADAIARAHAVKTAVYLRSSGPVLKKKHECGEVQFVAALYDVRSGAVEISS